jgi:hypothetical protein
MSNVIRLIFERSGGELVLVSRQRVDMTLPEPAETATGAAPPQFMAEVRDSDGQALNRTAVPNPLEYHREVFSGEGDESVHRVEVDEPEGAFTVVVPDHPEADHLSLLMAGPALESLAGLSMSDSNMAEEAAAAVPREIARVSLRDGDEAQAHPS